MGRGSVDLFERDAEAVLVPVDLEVFTEFFEFGEDVALGLVGGGDASDEHGAEWSEALVLAGVQIAT